MKCCSLRIHSDDGKVQRTDISFITLMFFDTIIAELSRDYGHFEYFEYEDEDSDRISVRSDEDLSAFITFLMKEGFATVWLVRASPANLHDIPAILPTDLEHLSVISHGQFSTVYRSVHMPTDRILAVKCIALENSEDRDRVFRELALMKQLSSFEYVVALVGAFMDSVVLSICLEYMDGGAIGRYGPIPATVLMFVSRSIFEGLQYLWKNRIMHRPNNILVNSSGYVKLTDFGLSKVMEKSSADSYVGTVMYMAPERICGGIYRLESDIWSFGLSLWELAIGSFPLPMNDDESFNVVSSYVLNRRICVNGIDGHPAKLCDLINGCLINDALLRWKLSDLIQSDYICDAVPVEHELIGCKLFVEDSSTCTAYFVNEVGIGILDDKLKLKAVILCSDQFDCFDPVNIDLLQDRNELCIILRNAQVITMDVESQAICTGCFLGEVCLAAAWSPDATVLTVVEDDKVVFYDRGFDIIGYWEMSSSEAGKDALVAVGWGTADTQFQGSAGKIARKKVEISRTAYPEDSHNSHIRWRADGSYVMVSFHERESNERRIAVFNREGELMARLKNEEPVEEIFAVRPTGNCIATTKRSSDGARTLVFYERNGEKRRETPLSRMAGQNRLINMQWDVESLCLCVHLQYDHKEELELWTESNYDWKRQWTSRFNQRITNWKWDTEKARRLCVLLGDGTYIRLCFAYSPVLAGSIALVIATEEIRFTDLVQRPIPPPMFEYAVPLSGAAQTFAFDGIRLAVVDSDFRLHLHAKDPATGQLSLAKTVQLNDVNWLRFISFLVWQDDDLLAVAHCENDRVIKVEANSGAVTVLHESSVPIVWMGVKPSSKVIMVATTNGLFEELLKDGETILHFQVPPSEYYDVKFADDIVIVLTPEHDLFVNGRLLADSVSSYLISDDVCIYITLHNKLRFVSLETRQSLCPERSVELGSNLIACCSKGANVVMQMPRGNLEIIHPRLFVIRIIKQLIDEQNYLEALKFMKKHRIDMNLLVDYKPDAFINDIPMLVRSMVDTDLMAIFIAALSNERSKYCDGTVIENKVNRIAGLVAKEILSLAPERRVNMFVVVLSALLKSSPPQVEEALRLMKKETDEINDERRDDYTRKWIHHIRYFVNETKLFNAALSTYDLSLTLQVAEMSNRDPKEYVPLLNELRKVEPDNYRKFQIDMIREDWKSALLHLSRVDDKWDEVVALIREKQLYSMALIIFKDSSKFKDICSIYAAVLESNAQWDEAALLYSRGEKNEKELRCLELSRNVERYVSRARVLGVADEVVNATVIKMATVLKASGRWCEVAKALEIAKAPTASIIEAYSKASQWLNAVDAAQRSKDVSLVRDFLVGRARSLSDEVITKSEELHRYAKRLAVVRCIKKENIIRLKEGIECGKELEEVDMMSEASSICSGMTRRTGKTGMSRASTTATVRKRKQIDRKKQSLKEGGEYEDSALLIALASHYHWLNDVMAELFELLPSLVRIDELALASSLQQSVHKFSVDANATHLQIWPNKLHPWDLPGPIYALYTVDDAFNFPRDGEMPGVVSLEPEMIAPVLNANLKWKLQILE